MKRLISLFFAVALTQGCASVQFGYALEPVDMYQERVATCGESYEIHELSYKEVIEKCDDHVGCTKFRLGNQPAQIFFVEGHKEVLAHEVNHCIAGGPRHEGDDWSRGLAAATFAR